MRVMQPHGASAPHVPRPPFAVGLAAGTVMVNIHPGGREAKSPTPQMYVSPAPGPPNRHPWVVAMTPGLLRACAVASAVVGGAGSR